MKKFKVDLSGTGVKHKTLFVNDFNWNLTHGQIIKEGVLTATYPQFFKEIVEETVEEKVEAPAEKTVEETVEAPVEEEVEETVEETVEEEVEETKSVTDIINEARAIKTKAELEEFGLVYGIDLNKQKSLRNMVKDLEAHLKA